ncbi:hypothetical protein ACWC5C_38920 [Streptomyces sp. NPDC001700]
MASVVIDRGGLFWARTTGGMLTVLPMLESYGYGAGPMSGTGGASAFAAYLQQLLNSVGQDAAARGRNTAAPSPQLQNWVRSDAARSGQEVSLDDLEVTSWGL